jgi:hypothetical protein
MYQGQFAHSNTGIVNMFLLWELPLRVLRPGSLTGPSGHQLILKWLGEETKFLVLYLQAFYMFELISTHKN